MRLSIARAGFIVLVSLAGLLATAAHALTAHTNNSITYITGGVTIDERDEMMRQRKDFSLFLKLVARSGKYLGDSIVTVKNANSVTVFECTTDGPWLLANLPAGIYNITVSSVGVAQSQKISIGKNVRRELMMYWNVIDKDDSEE